MGGVTYKRPWRVRQEEKERQAADAERELLQATHAQNEKLNRLNKERGQGGRFECPPACHLCYPPDAAQEGGARLGVRDLRGAGRVAPTVLRGKKGKCRACGVKIPRARWYCDPCKLHPHRVKLTPPPRFCACGCRERLPEACPTTKRYLNPTHQKRAYRARHGR